MKLLGSIFTTAFLLLNLWACQSGHKENSTARQNKLTEGTFAYDLSFLKSHKKTLLLENGSSLLAIVPDYQGRIMTSSANGMNGKSYGWINYELIASGESAPHFNNYGGEERFWLGPEGGQYAVFFKPGVSFVFDNWQVPAPIDSEPFELISSSQTKAVFAQDITLRNYSYFDFSLRIDRTVKLYSKAEVQDALDLKLPNNINFVGYETDNQITNTGEEEWTKKNGLLSVWILGQFISSPTNTVIVPFNPGPEEKLGPVVNDTYFGEIKKNRLVVQDSIIFFKADGQKRGKIGLSPLRSKNLLASFDSGGNVLTVVLFNKPDTHPGYVNSMWELQEQPFGGDVVNSYNDGPLDDGSQLGPFYELETSSPAAELKPGKTLQHISKTIHLTGDQESLELITKALFGIHIEQITTIFGK